MREEAAKYGTYCTLFLSCFGDNLGAVDRRQPAV